MVKLTQTLLRQVALMMMESRQKQIVRTGVPFCFNRTRNVAERGIDVAAEDFPVASGSGSFSSQDFLPIIKHELGYSGSSSNCSLEGENCDKKPVIGTDHGADEERNENSPTPPNFVIDRVGSGDQFIEEVPVTKEVIKRPLIEVSSKRRRWSGGCRG